MSRNADRLVNRDTVPVSTQRFLNIPIDSPLYTPIGRLVEQAHLTELPQLLHVLKGEMSLVGARPLPENVVSSLREVYPRAEDRFLTKSGLTGPVQLVGRDAIPDADRLRVEIAYSRGCLRSYSVLLDLTVLCLTVVIAVAVRRPMSVEEVLALIDRYTSAPSTVEKVVRRPESAGHPPDAKAS
jgi:lipopolysaccharide/colanic/teichoic acid biosynthesis glycosyltransferase